MTYNAPDPLRKLWRSRQYQAFDHALREGAVPRASMLRQALAPRSLGPDVSSLRESDRPHFASALLSIACSLGRSLDGAPSIAGQIAENGSVHLLAATICNVCEFSALPPDPRLPDALASIFAIEPHCARLGIASIKDACDGESPCFFARSDKPLWTLAPRLPQDGAHALLAQATLGGQTLDPAAAWAALHGELHRRRDPASLLALARHARAPTAPDFQRACTSIALAQLSEPHGSRGGAWMEGALALVEHLCSSHADMDGALCCQALIGSSRAGGAPRAASYDFLIPAPFTRQLQIPEAREAARAVYFLDWLERCSRIAAFHGMPDIGGAPLLNQRLEGAYASLAPEMALKHPFPLKFPSLAQAFDERKSTHSLLLEPHGASAPARPRLAL